MSKTGKKQKAAKSQCLIVLGMHRSGTSAFTGALQKVGVELGGPLMAPAPGENELGFFENLAIEKLNDRFLLEVGHSWDDLRGLSLSQLPESTTKQYQQDLQEILVEQFSGAKFWGVKDPRICLLLPLWFDVLDKIAATPHFLLATRPLAETVHSLANRNHFSLEKAAVLILQHSLSLELATRGFPRAFASYPSLLADPIATMQEIETVLRLRWPTHSKRSLTALTAFTREDLRHYDASQLAKLSTIPRFGKELEKLQSLNASAVHGDGQRHEQAFNALRKEFQKKLSAIDPLLLESSMSSHSSLVSIQEEIRDQQDRVFQLAKDTASGQAKKLGKNLESSLGEQVVEVRKHIHSTLEDQKQHQQEQSEVLRQDFSKDLEERASELKQQQQQLAQDHTESSKRMIEESAAALGSLIQDQTRSLREDLDRATADAIAALEKQREESNKLHETTSKTTVSSHQRLRNEFDARTSELQQQLASEIDERTRNLKQLLSEKTTVLQSEISDAVNSVREETSGAVSQLSNSLEESKATLSRTFGEKIDALENQIHDHSSEQSESTAALSRALDDKLDTLENQIHDQLLEQSDSTTALDRTFEGKLDSLENQIRDRSLEQSESTAALIRETSAQQQQKVSQKIATSRSELQASLQSELDQVNRALSTQLEQNQSNTASTLSDTASQLENQILELRKELARSHEAKVYLKQRLAEETEQVSIAHENIRGLQKAYTNLNQVVSERTDWLQKIDEELHRDRRTLWNIQADLDNRWRRFHRIRHLMKQSIRQPSQILPWAWRKFGASKPTFIPPHASFKKDTPTVAITSPIEAGDFQSSLEKIAFPKSSSPLISVVIPVYNDLSYTLPCLTSLMAVEGPVTFEVIVVDDASPDVDTSMLKKIPHLRYQRNRTNLGFIGTCNAGAMKAKGKYLLFLNNDTLVSPSCLARLYQTFQDFSDAGMVGGKLVYPDGQLQEAGGIVWRDGSAWNYGRGDDPETPEYNYCRAVDYCSGALLMIPRALFKNLGLFDTRYAPAYYEDTDLAFRVREEGLQVYYQPTASIIHFEGVSCGTDLNSGLKRFQEINSKTFYQRWQNTLISHRSNGKSPELERERSVEQRALIIDHRVLTPDKDSGSVRMWNLILVLKEMGYKVTFVPDNLDSEQPYTRELQAIGVETIYTPFCCSVESYLKKSGGLFDVVILSRLMVGRKYMDLVNKLCPQAITLFDTVDLHFLRERREAELVDCCNKRDAAEETKKLELAIARQADRALVVSAEEKILLEEIAPDIETHVVSNIHSPYEKPTPYRSRADLLFIGGFEHLPNVDGITWFCEEIFPKVKLLLPEAKLHIVGSKPTQEIFDLATDDIIVHGYVEDITPLFESCRVSIAPLRYGAGVKGKVNQSHAFGVPCVATPIACEGMHLSHGVDVMVCEKPDDFAQAVADVYLDPECWGRLSANGMENIRKHFSFEAARTALEKALSSAPKSK